MNVLDTRKRGSFPLQRYTGLDVPQEGDSLASPEYGGVRDRPSSVSLSKTSMDERPVKEHSATPLVSSYFYTHSNEGKLYGPVSSLLYIHPPLSSFFFFFLSRYIYTFFKPFSRKMYIPSMNGYTSSIFPKFRSKNFSPNLLQIIIFNE